MELYNRLSDYLNLFITTLILTQIVKKTHQYAKQTIADLKDYLEEHPSQNIKKSFGLRFAMGIVKTPPPLNDYGSTEPITETHFFFNYATEYILIIKILLHLNNKNKK